MPSNIEEPPRSAVTSAGRDAAPIDVKAAAEALKYGPRGALLVSSIAVGLLFLGWLAFYFLLFLPRGAIG
ncbi:MAG TPA: hypothetical protein VMI52_04920 [Acetobacteraceae bacterium]|nr:hypothetical protein [Acetobacteraceae bacterium]